MSNTPPNLQRQEAENHGEQAVRHRHDYAHYHCKRNVFVGGDKFSVTRNVERGRLDVRNHTKAGQAQNEHFRNAENRTHIERSEKTIARFA